MSWTADAPSGTYKNHALSGKIRESAVAQSQFLVFADTEPNFGKGRGDTLSITRVGNLPLANTVDENTELPSGRPLVDTKAITVDEWGYKIKMTKHEANLSHFDIAVKFQRALRDQLRLTMDKMNADALKSTPYKVGATSATGIIEDTDGTMSTSSTVNMNATHIQLMRDVMMGDLKVPTFADGSYVLIGSTKVVRGIKSDPNYQAWLSPTSSNAFVTGEVPRIENVRIIECNHFDALSNSIGTGGITGEAVMFGADAFFDATVEEPELRRSPPTDLGRFFDIGWVGTKQSGLVWDTASTARVLHWASA